jgi:hypothetical protein
LFDGCSRAQHEVLQGMLGPLRGDADQRDGCLSRFALYGSYGYQYSISIENTGNRTISAVEWMFIVTKTGSSEQPLEFTIYKKKKISPGKTRELSSVSDSGYYLTLAKPDKNTTPSFTTAVMIKRIEYSDGSIWERSSVMK